MTLAASSPVVVKALERIEAKLDLQAATIASRRSPSEHWRRVFAEKVDALIWPLNLPHRTV
jgi:hypothetical protein